MKLVNTHSARIFFQSVKDGKYKGIYPNDTIDSSEIQKNHPYITSGYLKQADIYQNKSDNDLKVELEAVKEELSKTVKSAEAAEKLKIELEAVKEENKALKEKNKQLLDAMNKKSKKGKK